MRESFEKRLRTFGEIAKDEKKIKKDDNGKTDEIESVLNWHLSKSAESSATGKEVQEDIYKLQKEKQDIIENLKSDISILDKKNIAEKISEKGREVLMAGDSMMLGEDGRPLTLGEIITDGEWDLDYSLDPGSIPRDIRKKYLVERAKIKVQKLLDEQIALNEQNSEVVTETKRDTYKRITEGKNMETPGLIAEKMVRNLLKKIAIDFKTDFEIIKADVFQDVNQKIDFIIKKKILEKEERGVKVEADNDAVGIQFTINSSSHNTRHKQKQIDYAKKDLIPGDNIKDIVLVAIPLRDINKKYNEWKKDKEPGGPDKLWSEKEKRHIFREIVNGLLPEEEVAELSGKIK